MSSSIFHPFAISAPVRRARSRAVSPAFTLVEMLTVIAIIAILIGLLFAAVKYARNSAARSRTSAQLDTLRGMLAELDAANKFAQSPPVWLWWDQNSAMPTYVVNPSVNSFTNVSGTFTADFWKYPWSNVNNAAASANWDALDAPGDVGNDGVPQQASQRNASFAILNTQLAMQMLAAIPGNRSAIDKLPANSKMTPQWDMGTVLLPLPFAAGSYAGLLKEDGSDTTMPNPTYVQGIHVSYQGRYYTCVVTPTAGTTPPAPSGSTPWNDETSSPRGAPLLLDGWGNPIIYVPATGLRIKMLNGAGTYQPGLASQDYIKISPEGAVTGQGTANPTVTRVGRPFFASAGPDGDFTKGDDNLYSFEN